MTAQLPPAPSPTPAQSPLAPLVETASTLGSSLVRLGTSVIAIPLSVLPSSVRTDTTNATREVFEAINTLNLSFIKAVSSVLDAWVREIDHVVAETTPRSPR
jgi:hypothetical protein